MAYNKFIINNNYQTNLEFKMTKDATFSSFENNELKSNAELVYLVKGIDANRSAWYYVLVEKEKLSGFLKALNDDVIHLESYGQILHSAYGDEPTEEITKKVKEDYGIQ
ncbi:MAG: hypothetical protein ACJA02_000096 [Myxococcota bacterium]|jgi:hypothetical protein